MTASLHPARATYRILILEDDQYVPAALARKLRKRALGALIASPAGADLEIALSGTVADAVAEACVGRYDVVVSDVDLPDGTGFEFAEKIRARGLKTPIVFMSADCWSGTRRAAAASFSARLLDKTEMDPIVEEALALAAGVERVMW